MKKKILIVLFISFCSTIYSIDNDSFRKNLINRIKFYDSNVKNSDIEIVKLNDDFSLAVRSKSFNYTVYISNGSELYEEDILISKKNRNIPKYTFNVNQSDFLVADFSFNEGIGILLFSVDSFSLSKDFNYIEIKDSQNYFFNKTLFRICFPGYKYLTPLDTYSYYEGKNKRVNSDYYISLNDISFCIVNNKRGFRINAIGSVYLDYKTYKMNINSNDDSNYVFFYWDKNEQCYILDESVTHDQLKNAYCPEDYFAYNGLKFSKLDSKLTEEDLKDLDKAQLRLMRNAVYARHGRTFKSVDLQSLWECYTWYKKNPNYSDDLLTETDKYNIEIIKSYENR